MVKNRITRAIVPLHAPCGVSGPSPRHRRGQARRGGGGGAEAEGQGDQPALVDLGLQLLDVDVVAHAHGLKLAHIRRDLLVPRRLLQHRLPAVVRDIVMVLRALVPAIAAPRQPYCLRGRRPPRKAGRGGVRGATFGACA